MLAEDANKQGEIVIAREPEEIKPKNKDADTANDASKPEKRSELSINLPATKDNNKLKIVIEGSAHTPAIPPNKEAEVHSEQKDGCLHKPLPGDESEGSISSGEFSDRTPIHAKKSEPLPAKDQQPPKKAVDAREIRITIDPVPATAQRQLSPTKVDSKKKQDPPRNSPVVKKTVPRRVVSPEVTRLMGIMNEPTDGDGWIRVVNEKNMTFYKKSTADCPVVMVRGLAVLEGIPLEVMWKAVADTTLRSGWESLMGTFEVLERNQEEHSEVVYYSMKVPFPFKDRDFVQKRTLLFDYPVKGQILMHYMSVENQKRPDTGNFVRAHTYIAGYLFKELSQFPLRCSIQLITQVDVKGLVPVSLVNMFAARSTRGWIETYRKGCLELMAIMKAEKAKK